MKSFGQVIKEARDSKGVSLDELSSTTKIKKQFLLAMETEKWDKLPDFPVLQGFVRLIGHALEVNEHKLVAFLRRDYPPKQLRVNPKPDIKEKFRVSSRFTFVVGALVLVLMVFGYLLYQYVRFISPPKLIIASPPDGFVTQTQVVQVSGSTTSDSVVKVNNQPFVVDSEGNFQGEIEVTKETKEIQITAESRYGKQTVVKRSIEVK